MKKLHSHSTISLDETNVASENILQQLPEQIAEMLLPGDLLTKFLSDAGIGAYLERGEQFFIAVGEKFLQGDVAENGHNLVQVIRDFINAEE